MTVTVIISDYLYSACLRENCFVPIVYIYLFPYMSSVIDSVLYCCTVFPRIVLYVMSCVAFCRPVVLSFQCFQWLVVYCMILHFIVLVLYCIVLYCRPVVLYCIYMYCMHRFVLYCITQYLYCIFFSWGALFKISIFYPAVSCWHCWVVKIPAKVEICFDILTPIAAHCQLRSNEYNGVTILMGRLAGGEGEDWRR